MPQAAPVQLYQAFGVPGEQYDDSAVRAEPFLLGSADATNNVFGRAFTYNASTGYAEAGQSDPDNPFIGFMFAPKEHASLGTAAGGPFAPTLALPNYVSAAFMNFGTLVVELPGAAAIGDLVVYDITDGTLDTIAPGATVPSGFNYANAVVDRIAPDTSGLAVIRISTIPGIPEAALSAKKSKTNNVAPANSENGSGTKGPATAGTKPATGDNK